MCTLNSDTTDQDVEETCSTASRDQYLPQSQVQESASTGSEDDLTSASDVDRTELFSFLKEMHSSLQIIISV